jgi:predicted nucleotidyltransferase
LRPVNTGRFAFLRGTRARIWASRAIAAWAGRPGAGYRECVLDDAVIAEAGRRLSEAAPPSSRVILFGSAARGELTRDSDLDFLVIEPEVENPALESVRLRRVLADVLVPMDIIVASEHRVQEWRDVRGSLIHAALTGGRELVA